jgi:hypothetical protein
MRPLVLPCLVALATGCVHTNASVLDPTVSYQRTCAGAVQVFTTAERVPSPYKEVALLNSKGESSWTDERGMLGSQRNKAAEVGANGLILGETREPNAGTKIIGSLFGTGAERKGKAIAIWIPADSERTREICSGRQPAAALGREEHLIQLQGAAPEPRLQDADRLPPLAAPDPRLEDADRLPEPASQPVRAVRPVARDSVLEAYRSATDAFAPLTRWVADLRSRLYYAAGCSVAVEIPAVERYYYQTEGAAQADGYRPGECR